MEGDLVKINEWLLPLSWLYGVGIGTRNLMFDMGILKSTSYQIPVINVGNISVGGTGKTPHVEYLIRLLKENYTVAVLSRGYKRKSSGYILSTPDTPMEQIGDEPWQMKQKFPDVHIAVDGNRRRGIHHLINDPQTRDVQIILLDDAYQHRYVTPRLNILLIDYHRMITDDKLLPAGRLRESPGGKIRANMVVVTKCPHDITPMGYRVIQSALSLKPFQTLFFSTFRYGQMRQAFGEKTLDLTTLRKDNVHTLLLTGIGNPQQMEQDLRRYVQHITTQTFADHHYFTSDDAANINQALQQLQKPRIIITTEKDATRLNHLEGLSDEVRDSLYILPIQVEIMRNETEKFNKKIMEYVLENT